MVLQVLHIFVTEVTSTDPGVFCLITVYQHHKIPNLRQRAVCSAV